MFFFVNFGVVFSPYVACGLSVILAHFRGEIDALLGPVLLRSSWWNGRASDTLVCAGFLVASLFPTPTILSCVRFPREFMSWLSVGSESF
jgi:hypothetical protein